MKDKVNRSFDNARDLILDWQKPPPFDAPPAVMIRATDPMTVQNLPDGVQPTSTPDGFMGWSEYPSLQFVSVLTVPGDHFSMFADHRVGLTA
jgi:hypothetical protein